MILRHFDRLFHGAKAPAPKGVVAKTLAALREVAATRSSLIA